MASGRFTLAQLARAVGMDVDEVRYYRDGGLLQPAQRWPGRRDEFCYTSAHVDRLHFIRHARAYGFSLGNVAQLVGERGLTTCNDVYRLSVDRLEELRRDAGSDDAAVRALEHLIATCGRIGGRSDCRILAALDQDNTRRRRLKPWAPRVR